VVQECPRDVESSSAELPLGAEHHFDSHALLNPLLQLMVSGVREAGLDSHWAGLELSSRLAVATIDLQLKPKIEKGI
jgi:hypothetical protein